MQDLVQQLIIGVSIGATYALIALGYTMVYGVLRLINFAHGEVYMAGAVSGFYIAQRVVPLHQPAWIKLSIVIVGAMICCAVLGFVIEFFAYRPLRSRPRLVSLITAIGVSLLLQNLGQIPQIFGPTPRSFPALIANYPVATFQISGKPIIIGTIDVLRLSLSTALMCVLMYVVLGTRTGLALRAVSYRVDTASLMGINTNRIISFTFMFGSALAAVAGVVDGMSYDVKPLMGVMPGLKAFIAAVLGGIGSIPGAMVGGLLIGIVETFVKYFYSAYSDAVVFSILILILLVRPSGLFGRPAAEKL
jgi:branched-chain amino acid transport system permease protein